MDHGCSALTSPCWWVVPGPLEETLLLDVVAGPVYETGEQWLSQGCCAISKFLGGSVLQKCKPSYLLLIVDIFICCQKQDGNSGVMAGLADLWVEVQWLLVIVPRRWPLDLQLCSADGTLEESHLSRPRNISMIWLDVARVFTLHLLEGKEVWVLNVFWLAFLYDPVCNLKWQRRTKTSGCSLVSRQLNTTSSLIQRRSEFMCSCVLEAIVLDLPF